MSKPKEDDKRFQCTNAANCKIYSCEHMHPHRFSFGEQGCGILESHRCKRDQKLSPFGIKAKCVMVSGTPNESVLRDPVLDVDYFSGSYLRKVIDGAASIVRDKTKIEAEEPYDHPILRACSIQIKKSKKNHKEKFVKNRRQNEQ